MMFMLTQNSRNTTAIDNGDFILSFRFYHYFCKAQRTDAVRDFDARGKPRVMQPAVAPSAVDMVREAENNFAKESFHLTYQGFGMNGRLHVFAWHRSHQSLTTKYPIGSAVARPLPIGLWLPQSSHVLVAEPVGALPSRSPLAYPASSARISAVWCSPDTFAICLCRSVSSARYRASSASRLRSREASMWQAGSAHGDDPKWSRAVTWSTNTSSQWKQRQFGLFGAAKSSDGQPHPSQWSVPSRSWIIDSPHCGHTVGRAEPISRADGGLAGLTSVFLGPVILVVILVV